MLGLYFALGIFGAVCAAFSSFFVLVVFVYLGFVWVFCFFGLGVLGFFLGEQLKGHCSNKVCSYGTV